MSVNDDDRLRDDNERRVERMNVWIDLAGSTPDDDDHAHIRFVYYWIAYEAAYQNEHSKIEDGKEREKLHHRLAKRDRGRLQGILHAQKKSIVSILALRQAHPSFWNRWREDAGVRTREEWERVFGERVGAAVESLDEAIRSGIKNRISGALDGLFRNLSVVRHQIVHGGSAGRRSRGRTQVTLGAKLLRAFIPCFRDSIESDIDQDWGEPPFPRVGSGPDEECPPPWLERRSR